ncbi:Hypothetical protein MVR_LOCUS63 [uncultured virus]|nr:Hypothetical protein MVR_LOCUS63 [uncultured virus]
MLMLVGCDALGADDVMAKLESDIGPSDVLQVIELDWKIADDEDELAILDVIDSILQMLVTSVKKQLVIKAAQDW